MRNDLDLKATTPTGDRPVGVGPFVTADGVPKVVLFTRTDGESAYASTLDGHPAVTVFLGEQANGPEPTPWELGELFIEGWEAASKRAKEMNGGLENV